MLILAKVNIEQEFVEWTGKYYDTPVFRDVKVPQALVYSSDDSEKEKAETFAKSEGYELFVLPDTDDVLQKAKAIIICYESYQQKHSDN